MNDIRHYWIALQDQPMNNYRAKLRLGQAIGYLMGMAYMEEYFDALFLNAPAYWPLN